MGKKNATALMAASDRSLRAALRRARALLSGLLSCEVLEVPELLCC